MMNPFEDSVAAALGSHSRGTVFLAAVSGGADSTAMLAALAALMPEEGFILHCLHVDHGIRPASESRGDGEFVAGLCQKFAVPCRIAAVPPGRIAAAAKKLGTGIEAAARIYRRRAWNREARRIGAAAVLTAHTRDDLLETVLMRILRGSGPAGLAAMPVRRGRILRPLLQLCRSDVLCYLEEKGLSHRTDPSNGDNRFFRNAIRNRLIPLLDELYPPWKGALGALAETQRMTADFLAAEAAARLSWEVFRGGRELRAEAAGFFALPPILREEALFQGIDRLPPGPSRRGRRGAENPVPVKRSNVRKFYAGEFSALDLGSCRIRRSPSRVILSGAAGKTHEAGFSLLIKAPGLYKLKGLTFELLPVFCPGGGGEGFFASLPLLVRRSMSGDRLVVRGRKFGPPDLDAGDSAILCAADASGIAAFIGSGGGGAALLLARGRGPETEKSGGFAGTYYCKVSYTGGVDV